MVDFPVFLACVAGPGARVRIPHDLGCSDLRTVRRRRGTSTVWQCGGIHPAVSGAAGSQSLQLTALRSSFCIQLKQQRNVLCVINSVVHPIVVEGFKCITLVSATRISSHVGLKFEGFSKW